MITRLGFAAMLFISMMNVASAQSQSGDPSGVWLTQQGDAQVRVRQCPGGICATVVWLREPNDPATGQPARDTKNPNPSLAQRPIIGHTLFSGMAPSGTSRWSGTIYNADDGKTYASNVAMTGPNSLRVEGCIGALCGNETWRRVR